MKQGKQTKAVAPPTLLDRVLAQIPFTEETIPAACMNQSMLYVKAARIRTEALRRKNDADMNLLQVKAKTAIDLRTQFEGEERKVTEAKLKEILELEPAIIHARTELARAEENDEWARHLVEAVRGRREMIRVLASLVTPGVADMTIPGRRM